MTRNELAPIVVAFRAKTGRNISMMTAKGEVDKVHLVEGFPKGRSSFDFVKLSENVMSPQEVADFLTTL